MWTYELSHLKWVEEGPLWELKKLFKAFEDLKNKFEDTQRVEESPP